MKLKAPGKRLGRPKNVVAKSRRTLKILARNVPLKLSDSLLELEARATGARPFLRHQQQPTATHPSST
jgi:hypothetical protein